MPEAVLALDQGTTGSLALVLSRDGQVLGRAYAPIRQSYPQPGWVEHDPEEIWQTSLRVMQEALAAAGVGPRELRALGITNQRETTVVWDRRTGRPLHPAIVWQSRQTAAICEGLRGAGYEPMVRRRSGLVLDAYFSGTKLRFILDQKPGIRSAAEAGDVVFGTVDTWLLFKLTGGAVHATDPTNASRTLLFDIHERRWHPELLRDARRARRHAARGAAERRRLRRDRGPGRAARRRADLRHGRGPAGRPLRPATAGRRAWPRTPTAPGAS